MKKTLMILSLFISIQSYAEYQCSGGKEACNEGRELYHLERITGKSCAGGYESCLEYLQNEYDKMSLERDIRKEIVGLRPLKNEPGYTDISRHAGKCIYLYTDNKGREHSFDVCY